MYPRVSHLAILAESFEIAQEMLDSLAHAALLAGIHINISKTKVLVLGSLASLDSARSLSLNGS